MPATLVFVVLVALFATLPIVLDICLAYWSMNSMRRQMLDKASLDKLTLNELKQFVKESGTAPPGIPGLSRATMALTALLILSAALFQLIAGKPSPENSQTVNNVLSMLAGLLAAITGFYFGGKSTQQAARPADTGMAKAGPAPAAGDKPLT